CINTACPARVAGELLHWASRGVMNIEGLGDAMVAQLLGQTLEAPEPPPNAVISTEAAKSSKNAVIPTEAKRSGETPVFRNAELTATAHIQTTETGAPVTTREPLIHSIGDLYCLTKPQLLSLERVGEKTADTLLEQIRNSKDRGLAR